MPKATALVARSFVVQATVIFVSVFDGTDGPSVITGAVVSGAASVAKLKTLLRVALSSGSAEVTCAKYVVSGVRPVTVIEWVCRNVPDAPVTVEPSASVGPYAMAEPAGSF